MANKITSIQGVRFNDLTVVEGDIIRVTSTSGDTAQGVLLPRPEGCEDGDTDYTTLHLDVSERYNSKILRIPYSHIRDISLISVRTV